MTPDLRACGEAALGCVLVTVNAAWWAGVLHDLNIALSTGSLFCGLIIGVHGVWRIFKGRK